ncbi:hypothetical protein [Streptomyces sp. WAC04114]|uniref:hypothetical protein n=1 Tax=Streptomyces sp. WAC04114 TaxID=2867961 RepID=UPI0027E1D6C2|nr:hypothetical protein [Streptomyces sp. WAC04114]
MGRTTVHRYFPERSDLLAAISADLLDKVEAATERARLDGGPAAETGTTSPRPTCTSCTRSGAVTPRAASMPSSTSSGVHNPVWALLYTAWEHTRTTGTPKHSALTLCLHTLRKAIAP